MIKKTRILIPMPIPIGTMGCPYESDKDDCRKLLPDNNNNCLYQQLAIYVH